MSDKDFHKLFELVIDEMLEICKKDISLFHLEYNEVWECEDGAAKTPYRIRERVILYSNGLHDVTAIFKNFPGTMEIYIDDDRHDIDIGWGAEHSELKKKFMRLYSQVEYFREVEEQQEQLESFYSAISDVFPQAVDKLIFEEIEDDQKD